MKVSSNKSNPKGTNNKVEVKNKNDKVEVKEVSAKGIGQSFKSKVDNKNKLSTYNVKHQIPSYVPKTFQSALNNIKNERLNMPERVFAALLVHFEFIECTEDQKKEFGEVMDSFGENGSSMEEAIWDIRDDDHFGEKELSEEDLWNIALQAQPKIKYEKIKKRIDKKLEVVHQRIDKDKVEVEKYKKEFLSKYPLPSDAPKSFEEALNNINDGNLEGVAARVFSALLIQFKIVECTDKEMEDFYEEISDLIHVNEKIFKIFQEIIEKFGKVENFEAEDLWAIALSYEEDINKEELSSSLIKESKSSNKKDEINISLIKQEINDSFSQIKHMDPKLPEELTELHGDLNKNIKNSEAEHTATKTEKELMKLGKDLATQCNGLVKDLRQENTNGLNQNTETILNKIKETTDKITNITNSAAGLGHIDKTKGEVNSDQIKNREIREQFKMVERLRDSLDTAMIGFSKGMSAIAVIPVKIAQTVLLCLKAIGSLLLTIAALPFNLVGKVMGFSKMDSLDKILFPIKVILGAIFLPIAILSAIGYAVKEGLFRR